MSNKKQKKSDEAEEEDKRQDMKRIYEGTWVRQMTQYCRKFYPSTAPESTEELDDTVQES